MLFYGKEKPDEYDLKMIQDYISIGSLEEIREAGNDAIKINTNLINYGFPTWTEWCPSNWRVNSNAYYQSKNANNKISFSTDWNDVLYLMTTLSLMNPDLKLKYTCSDMTVVKTYLLQNGEICHKEEKQHNWPHE